MNAWISRLALLVLAAPFAVVAAERDGTQPAGDDAVSGLYATIAALDEKLFDASNRCDLETFGSLLADDLEFYHDQAGVTWTAQALIAATEQNICGKVRRELIPGTLEVDRIEGFGAVEMGSHRFCKPDGDTCMGSARFMHVWKHENGQWKLSRVISFGHRPLPDAK
jgi:ketosteroid isomerase-like protein